METNNEERERLAREYFTICYNVPSWKWEQFGKEEHDIWYRIADHIIADRARIVAPLMNLINEAYFRYGNIGGKDIIRRQIKKTLKLAGVKI